MKQILNYVHIVWIVPYGASAYVSGRRRKFLFS